MKKRYLIWITTFCLLFAACALNRHYVTDYGEKMTLVKVNFPEIYDMYKRGQIIINEVYTYEKDGKELVHVNYIYR